MKQILIGETLKELRKTKEISQKNLAELLNVSVKTISHWETNYSEPSLTQLCKLVDIFDISTDEFLGRE